MKSLPKVAFLTGAMRYRRWVGTGAALILGAIFVIAGAGKIPQQTETYVIIFGLPKSTFEPLLANYIDLWLPRVELGLGILLVLGIAAKPGAVLAAAFSVAFVVNNGIAVFMGWGGGCPCGCFGAIPILGQMTITQALWIDIGMLALGLVILFFYPKGWLTLRPWFFNKSEDTG